MTRPVIRLSDSLRSGLRLKEYARIGPLRLFASQPLGAKTTASGRHRRANAGWSLDLFPPSRKRR